MQHFLRLPDLETSGEEFHVAVQTEVMLTPSFDIRQNNECVIIDIRAPYIKVYVLKHFPRTITIKATLSVVNLVYVFRYQKRNFTSVDMISSSTASHIS